MKDINMTESLFTSINKDNVQPPLADRMRPRTLNEMYGQKELIGEGKLLRRVIQADKLTSCIFYGPPGCGKTTLASIIANNTKAKFEKLNAVTSGVADVRKIINEAKERRLRFSKSTYLLLDECHRWSKTQSDSILPAIESGLIRFIGSTTENPSVSMTPAIVSRCRVFQFKAISTADTKEALNVALKDNERGFGNKNINIDDISLNYIATTASGDVRAALSALELAVLSTQANIVDGVETYNIDIDVVKECVQKPVLSIDEQKYYDMISALIKSMRGSDSNAALLWLARLIHAGVDARIIARRVMVHASEDVGLADPLVLLQAHAAVKAIEFIGMPEARIPLAQAVIAICEAAKSNSVVMAIDKALNDAQNGEFSPVPRYLCDHSYPIPGESDKGSYLYPHDYKHHIVQQNYMPEGFENKEYYVPSNMGYEAIIEKKREERKHELNQRKKM